MKPGLTNVLSVALGIISPQMFYLIIHGVDFAVLLSGIDQIHPLPYVSCTLCTHKQKGSHQTLDFTRLRKHLQDLHF